MSAALVGRATELAALRDDVRGACAGHGRLVMICGDAGIGKTAVAAALADEASANGSHVVWTSLVVPADAPMAWPWPAILRELGDGPLADALETGPGGVRVFEAVVAAIVRAAAERPLTIVIDDADRMRDVGQDLLAFVGAQLALRSVLIVATARNVLERLESGGTTVVLHGLAEPGVAELLRAHGLVADEEVTRAVHAATGGNPSEIVALVPSLRSATTRDDVVEAVIAYAEQEAAHGGRRAADRWVRRAYDVAEEGDHLARVALLLHTLGATTSVSDDDRVELLRTAHRHAHDAGLRAKVLAASAREAYHIDAARGLGDAARTADEAVALAREADDPDALAFCLLAKHDTEWRPGSAAARLRLADEIVELRPSLEGVLARYVAYLELGDRRADREFDRFVQLAGRDKSAHAHYVLSTRRAMRAMMTGDLAQAERIIDESVELAKRFGEPDGFVVALNQRFELHSERGDRAVLLPTLERARDFSSHAAVVASLALARVDANDELGARALVEPYANVDLGLVKPEYGRVWVLSMLGEAFARLEMHEPTARAAAAMLPFSGTNVVLGGGVVFHGAVDHHIGVLLAACGDDGAESHLRAALEMHERVGAIRWSARTAHALSVRDAHVAPTASMSFDGSLWTISFAGTTVTMKDAKGLRDIAQLVRNANTEINAAELVGATDEARLGADLTLDAQARRAYRARIDALEDAIERADRSGDRAASDAAAGEREALIRELGAAVGLVGRSRRLGDTGERARKAVSARIRDTVRNIEARHPALAAHLREVLVTGTNCCYKPDPPVTWEVRQIESGD